MKELGGETAWKIKLQSELLFANQWNFISGQGRGNISQFIENVLFYKRPMSHQHEQ